MLSKLNTISVRENRSAEIAKGYTGRDVRVVLDPDAWNQIAEPDSNSGKYILVYSVSSKKLLTDFVRKLADQA